MHRTKPISSETLQTIAPWAGATMAVLIACIILSHFIDTLHLSIQRGQDLRAGVNASATTERNTGVRLADAGTRQQRTVR